MNRNIDSPSENHAQRAKRDAGHRPFMYSTCGSLTSQNFIEFADYRRPWKALPDRPKTRLTANSVFLRVSWCHSYLIVPSRCQAILNFRIQIEKSLETCF